LVEAEIRSAMIEAEIREQVMQEYNQKMLDMEALFSQNMANEVSPHRFFFVASRPELRLIDLQLPSLLLLQIKHSKTW
jgi:hypothetical protein